MVVHAFDPSIQETNLCEVGLIYTVKCYLKKQKPFHSFVLVVDLMPKISKEFRLLDQEEEKQPGIILEVFL